MKKFFLISALLLCFTGFAQEKSQESILQEIVALKASLPGLKGISKVDALNRLAYNYFSRWINWRLEADSAYPFALQAYNEAKKIGYKKGLAYSYLRLGTADDLKFGFVIQVNKKFDSSLLSSAEKNARKAISIGQQISDNAIIGAGYSILAGCAYDRTGYTEQPDYTKYITLLEKSISYYQLAKKEDKYQGLYRDLNDFACNNCVGVETQIAKLYNDCTGWGVNARDFSTLEAYQNKAIEYFFKANNKASAAGAYLRLSFLNGIKHGGQFLFDEEGETALKKAISLYRETGDEEGELNAISALCGKYFNSGNFEDGLEYGKRMTNISEKLRKNKPAQNIEWGLFWMSAFYQYAGDYETALKLLYRMNPNYEDSVPREIRSASIGEVYRKLGDYDSAKYYLTPFATNKIFFDPAKTFLGNLYLDLKQYDKGIQLIKENIETQRKKGQQSNANVARSLSAAAEGYYLKGNYDSALKYSRESLAALKTVGLKIFLIDNYKLQSEIFNKIGRHDSAYYYLNLYNTSKDSLLNRQFLWRMNNFKKEVEEERKTGKIQLLEKDNLIKQQQLQQQILVEQENEAQLSLLDRDNRIKDQRLEIKDQKLKEQLLLQQQKQSQLTLLDNQNKLKDQRLKQEAFVRNALVAGLFLFLVLGVFVFRLQSLKRKNERLRNDKIQAQLQHQSSELEMQALRAQMNPHFIFNCLSSINKFILKNESQPASDYLTRFSRLIRRVLTNSQLSLIPLSDEIEMLKLYLDMERLRFDNAFEYNIVYTNTIEPETVYIPPMLLQPFCENAIWHGLMHKEGKGKLEIEMSIQNRELHCIIADNGIGRTKAGELKSTLRQTQADKKQKSFGLKITAERLALFNNDKHIKSYYDTEDIYDAKGNIAGTKVKLVIKYKDAVSNLVNEAV